MSSRSTQGTIRPTTTPRTIAQRSFAPTGRCWATLVCAALIVAAHRAPSLLAAHESESRLGPVSCRVTLSPETPRVGDILELTIEVASEPDVEVLMPEFGDALDAFQIIDFVPRQSVDSEGRNVATQRYSLQPDRSGRHRIPPILIEFIDRRPGEQASPDGQDAYELLSDRIDFEVASLLQGDQSTELRHPLGELTLRGPLSLVEQTARWGIWGTLGFAVAGTAFWWWRNKWHRAARRRTAYEVARGRLDRLLSQPLPQGEQVERFFVELSQLVREYLEHRFELRAPELTTEEFLERATAATDLSTDHRLLLQRFLRQSDLVKFAGLQPAETDIRESLHLAERFLEETRNDEAAPAVTTSVSHVESTPREATRDE